MALAALLQASALALLASGPVPAGESSPPPRRTVTVLGFSDYHAHALPHVSEGHAGQGGIARAIGLARAERSRAETLVVSGGDTFNAGAPAWSDAYRCRDWPWWNGLLDAMALGNHDLDYGPEELDRCRRSASYPVLSANLLRSDGTPHLLADGRPYVVRTVAGLRIGLFAVAGPDMPTLVRADRMPPGTRWGDAVAAAREVVRALREEEKASAVILIGHQQRRDDEALARAVPGIDLVLGTHSHLKVDLLRIPGTSTWFVSPYQYLAYGARVRLAFEGERLVEVSGGLVPLDETVPPDPEVAARVAEMQAELLRARPERFEVVGQTRASLDDAGVSETESLVGNWATEALRRATGTQAFLSTSSSFRGSLPAGEVTLEDFLTAVPYANRLVRTRLAGRELLDLVRLCAERRGGDDFCQQSGLRVEGTGAGLRVSVLRDPARPQAGHVPVDPETTYAVGTTDYQALVVQGYRELFARARDLEQTDLDAHEVLRSALAAGGATATRDGRWGGPDRTGPDPARPRIR